MSDGPWYSSADLSAEREASSFAPSERKKPKVVEIGHGETFIDTQTACTPHTEALVDLDLERGFALLMCDIFG